MGMFGGTDLPVFSYTTAVIQGTCVTVGPVPTAHGVVICLCNKRELGLPSAVT